MAAAPTPPHRDRRRVVITGVGTVNARTAGGAAAVAEALAAPAPAPASAWPPARSRLGAQVDEQQLASLADADAARRISRICRLTVAACRLAVADAGIPGGTGLAIVVGSEHGDFRSSEQFAD